MNKRILASCLTIFLLLCTIFPVLATAADQTGIVAEKEVTQEIKQLFALAELQKPAVEAHETLYNSFVVEGSATEVYPANYGGDYIDGSMLHVCIVDLPNQDITSYETLLSEHLDNVVFEDVEYPLQSLLDATDDIASTLMENGVIVVSTGISEPNNAVVVRVDTSSNTSNTQLSSLSLNKYQSDKNPVILGSVLYESESMSFPVPTLFEEGSVVEPAANLMGGSSLSGYTAGVCGTYNGKPAIGMCGHGLSSNSSIKDTNGTTVIGTVSDMQYGDGKSGDYAIITITNSNYTTSAIAGDPSISSTQTKITGTIARAATGLAIIKYGKNAGFAYGIVDSSSSTWYPDNTTMPSGIKRMVSARLSMGSVVKGDSGGPVYTSDGQFCGTVSSTSYDKDDGFTYFFFSPYTYLSGKGFAALTS